MASSDKRGADRIIGRLDRSELKRTSMPDGGSVYRGPLASRALQAVGARAMTIDRSIIVEDDFNLGRPEDSALYAHERHHELQGDGRGGGGGDNFRDAEEVAARATEALVFHRMTGGYEAGHEGGAGPGHFDPQKGQQQGHGVAGSPQGSETMGEAEAPDSAKGYWALRQQGWKHEDIVAHLATQVLSAVDERQQVKFHRQGDKRGSF